MAKEMLPIMEDDVLLDGETAETPAESGTVYPTEVRVNRAQFSCSHIKTMIERRHALVMAPDFQRNSVWKVTQQSELVESILMGIPIPVIYLFEDKNGIKQIVDGKQRITAIVDFLNDKYSLRDLKILKEYNRKKFSLLPLKVQGVFEDYQLNVYVIQPPTPERVKYDIFDRVNRAGTPLTHQEMREALYTGESTKMLKDLSKDAAFLKATEGRVSPKRKKDHYLILRSIAFLLMRRKADTVRNENGESIDYKSDIDDFLAKMMIYLNEKASAETRNYCRTTFLESMRRINEVMPSGVFRFRSEDGKLRPVNMPLFESLTILFADERVCRNPEKTRAVVDETKALWNEGDLFRGTNVDSVTKLTVRFDDVDGILKKLS